MGSEDVNMNYLGCVCNTYTIKCSTGEAVSISAEFLSANLAKSSTLTTPQALSSDDVYVFTGGSISYGGSTISSILDSVELSINNTFEIFHGLGSRTGQKAKAKQREYGLKFTLKLDRKDLLEDFLGGTTGPASYNPTRTAEVKLTFIRNDGDYVEFVCTGNTIDEWADGMSYGEVMTEEITMIFESLSVNEVQS